jgi:hypothetical protein
MQNPTYRAAALNRRLLICIILILCSCVGKSSFQVVELCVRNQADLEFLKDELRQIAAAENLTYIDASGYSAQQLRDIGYSGAQRTDGSPVVFMQIGRKDGMGVGVGNTGSPGFQIALGFTAGRDSGEAARFSKRVIAQLSQRWNVWSVPKGTGAMPMKDCQ